MLGGIWWGTTFGIFIFFPKNKSKINRTIRYVDDYNNIKLGIVNMEANIELCQWSSFQKKMTQWQYI